MGMMDFVDTVRDHAAYKNTMAFGAGAYGFIKSQLWPAYSVGMVVGSLCVIASMFERQIIADALYGNSKELIGEEKQDTLDQSMQLFEEELQRAVKVDVYSMPQAQFDEEHRLTQQ